MKEKKVLKGKEKERRNERKKEKNAEKKMAFITYRLTFAIDRRNKMLHQQLQTDTATDKVKSE